MPKNSEEWITHSDDGLSRHKREHWVSLQGAKPSDNKSTQTIYLPKAHRFETVGLAGLMASLSRNEIPEYQEIDHE